MPTFRRWRDQSLVTRFLTAGGAVMLAAMLATGTWMTARIEQSVVDNSATAAALYVESFVAPLSQELASRDTLSEPAARALQELFANTPIGDRIVSFRIWKPGGLVTYASDPALVGRTLPPSEELRDAWAGQVSGTFSGLGDAESAGEAALGLPLLEVYSPIRELWSGDVIAVAEFYEVAAELERDLADARRVGWLLVAVVFVGSGAVLTGIVRAGGRTIERQRALLEQQVSESQRIAAQNGELRRRAIGASARATEQAERRQRQVSADLHDGPAQYIALAALRLDGAMPDTESGRREAAALREALQTALAEIRTISRGLSLPDLGGLPLAEVARRAVGAHLRPEASPVTLSHRGLEDPQVDDSVRTCLYRFLQEGLSNAARHAEGAQVDVSVAVDPDAVTATIHDDGPGFKPGAEAGIRTDGGQGLAGLRDRAESLGGTFAITSAPGTGTTLTLTLPLGREEDTP